MKKTLTFRFEVFKNIEELTSEDAKLLKRSRQVTEKAYAPYSNFFVGAAALLLNGKIVEGTNQENASFPAGICAERTLLSTASSIFPGVGINTLAISYHNNNEGTESNHPISPCGVCRQSLIEFQARTKHNMRIILSGMEGDIYLIEDAKQLLPLSFSAEDML